MRTTILKTFFLLILATANGQAAELNTRVIEDMGTLDWTSAEVTPMVVQQIAEGLTVTDLAGHVRAGLAVSWTSTQKGYQWRFKLKKNARWSDGQRVCATDFVSAWTRALDPKSATPYVHYFDDIKSYWAEGCGTLIVTLHHKSKYLPAKVSHTVFAPVRGDLLNRYNSKYFEPEHLVTTGPYYLKRWQRDRLFALQANPHYHSKKPFFNSLNIYVVPDDATALNLFHTKKIQWMKDIPYQARASLIHLSAFHTYPALIGYFFGFDMQHGATALKDVRCALARSLNTSEIPQILDGNEEPAAAWMPQALWKPAQNQLSPLFDIKAAQKHFAAARPMFAQSSLEVTAYHKDIHTPVMEWAQAQWKKHLGIDVVIKTMESKSYWSLLRTSPPQIFLSGTTAWFAHPYAFLSELGMASTGNWGRYQSKQYEDGLLALQDSNASDASPLILKMQKTLLLQDCAMAPLYFRKSLTLSASTVEGVEINPLGVVSFQNAKSRHPD